jgi:SAM-dependent methyltransferase
MKKERKDFLAAVDDLKTTEDTRELYDQWAAGYDADLLDGCGYRSPEIVATAFAERVSDRACRIIDLGCGTGLVGVALAARGFTHMDGLDISTGMLEEARGKGVYENLFQGDLTASDGVTGIADGTYDAMLCANSFASGHVGPEHLDGLIRTVKPDGPMVLYINAVPFVEDGYPKAFKRLEDAGAWTVETLEASNYMDEIQRPGWLVVARRGALC